MSGISLLLLGVGLGLRHAFDADHVLVVAALVQQERSVSRAARIAALWGAGHTAAFLGLGLLIVLGEVRVPDTFERAAELVVAAMLIGFGAWHFLRARRRPSSSPGSAARPVLVGLIHGLAGSAGVALLAATTIGSRTLAIVYLGLVALGTVVGMVALTVAMSGPMRWAMRGSVNAQSAVGALAALLSLALGLSVLGQALSAELVARSSDEEEPR